MKSFRGLTAFLLCLGLARLASAQTPAQTFELPLQGIKIESDANGLWQRIYATGHQPVTFPDRSGITTAQKIAEERAKAEIIKFFQQQVSAETLVKDMEATQQTARRTQGTAADASSRVAYTNRGTGTLRTEHA